jgi:hypothetical protein
VTADDEAARTEAARLQKVEVVGMPGIYGERTTRSATKTETLLVNIPQSVTIVNDQLIRDQRMQGMADVVRYVPGVQMAQGEGNRDTPILRGSSSTADMFVDGVRDDVQYFRDLYNIQRVEALKGPNAMIFGRGGSGGVLNRVSKQADFSTVRGFDLTWGTDSRGRAVADWGQALGEDFAFRLTALKEDTGSYRDDVDYQRVGINPTLAWRPGENLPLPSATNASKTSAPPTAAFPHSTGARSTAIPPPSSAIRSAARPTSRSMPSACARARLRQWPECAQPHALREVRQVLPEHLPGHGIRQRHGADPGVQQRHPARQQLQPDRPDAERRRRLLAAHPARRFRVRPPGNRQLPQHRLLPPNKCPSTSGGNTVTSTAWRWRILRYEGSITWSQSASDGD